MKCPFPFLLPLRCFFLLSSASSPPLCFPSPLCFFPSPLSRPPLFSQTVTFLNLTRIKNKLTIMFNVISTFSGQKKKKRQYCIKVSLMSSLNAINYRNIKDTPSIHHYRNINPTPNIVTTSCRRVINSFVRVTSQLKFFVY